MKRAALVALLLSLHASRAGEVASWYGHELEGRPMANTKPFDPHRFTCAVWHVPLGSLLLVTNPQTEASVRVVVTDRGPAPWTGATIDLSEAAFRRLAALSKGHLRVKVRLIRSGHATSSHP